MMDCKDPVCSDSLGCAVIFRQFLYLDKYALLCKCTELLIVQINDWATSQTHPCAEPLEADSELRSSSGSVSDVDRKQASEFDLEGLGMFFCDGKAVWAVTRHQRSFEE